MKTVGRDDWEMNMDKIFDVIIAIMSSITTIGAIVWSYSRTKKDEEKRRIIGLLKYLEYIMDKNLENIGTKKKISWTYILSSYATKKWWITATGISWNDQDIICKEFNVSFLESNYKEIFEKGLGREILDLNEKFIKYNEVWKILAIDLNEKKKLLETIKKDLEVVSRKYTGTEQDYIENLYLSAELLEQLSLALFALIKDNSAEYYKEIIKKIMEKIIKNYNYNSLTFIQIEKVLDGKNIRELCGYINKTASYLQFQISSHKVLKFQVDIGKIELYIWAEKILLDSKYSLEKIYEDIQKLKIRTTEEKRKIVIE